MSYINTFNKHVSHVMLCYTIIKLIHVRVSNTNTNNYSCCVYVSLYCVSCLNYVDKIKTRKLKLSNLIMSFSFQQIFILSRKNWLMKKIWKIINKFLLLLSFKTYKENKISSSTPSIFFDSQLCSNWFSFELLLLWSWPLWYCYSLIGQFFHFSFLLIVKIRKFRF